MTISIEGLQKAQRANLQMIAALRPTGSLGRALKYASLAAHRHAVAVTPYEHGALRASERVEANTPYRWRIFIDPGAIAPRRDERPAVYGARLHQQGLIPGKRPGTIRAFFQYTVKRYGDQIGAAALREIRNGLP